MHRLSLLQLSLAVGVVLGLGAGVAAYVLRDEPPLPPCDLPTEAQLADTVEASARWMARALQANNRYWYEYDRVADEFAANYFDVRHAGVMLSLDQVAAGVEVAPRQRNPIVDRGFVGNVHGKMRPAVCRKVAPARPENPPARRREPFRRGAADARRVTGDENHVAQDPVLTCRMDGSARPPRALTRSAQGESGPIRLARTAVKKRPPSGVPTGPSVKPSSS